MAGVGEDGLGRPVFDDTTAVDDVDPVGELAHDTKVVGNEEHRRLMLVGELAHELQGLRLHRHVQRRPRLVGDQQLGLIHQRHGNHHPLVHAAGELEWIARQHPFDIRDRGFGQRLPARCAGSLHGWRRGCGDG